MKDEPIHHPDASQFNNSTTILYVEPYHNADLNNYIQDNYLELVRILEEILVDFIYLPNILEDQLYKRIFEYNHPVLSTTFDKISVDEIYSIIFKGYNISPNQPVLIAVNSETTELYKWKPIDIEQPYESQFKEFSDEYISFRYPAFKRRIVDSVLRTEEPLLASVSNEFNNQFAADNDKDDELEAEIWAKIELLKEKGSLAFIGKVIEALQGVTCAISPLFITNDYRIFLKDYGMKEVIMPPLSKCLFFLYLRHPEGIQFKGLCDYHDELLSIYRNVTIRENIDTAIESILAMTNPLNNSVNEKASRIRAAFLEIITDELAKNYYITGRRGELKKITLDRSLVEYQK